MVPFLDPYYNTGPNLGTQKGTIILTIPHILKPLKSSTAYAKERMRPSQSRRCSCARYETLESMGCVVAIQGFRLKACLGFRIQGLESGVWGSGFGALCFRFKACGFQFRVQSLGPGV